MCKAKQNKQHKSLSKIWSFSMSQDISSTQSLGCVRLFVTHWTTACQAFLSITNSRSLLKLTSSRWWCHPAVSVVPFSSCCQSFPASGSFPMSQLFMSGGQTIVISHITWHIFSKLFCDDKTDMWGASWRGYRSWSLVAETMVKELCVLNKSCIHLRQISSTVK